MKAGKSFNQVGLAGHSQKWKGASSIGAPRLGQSLALPQAARRGGQGDNVVLSHP